ncbi:uncharacterized protein [Argopecten irradians]|uniref:uncharacterized protein n=1 Tax=Argopecten irradians TaxID=31199 RepID=UPI003720FD85
MKSFLPVILIEAMVLGLSTCTLDITSQVDIYASLRPFSLVNCIEQCIQRPRCNSILLEEKTKTCFLNRKIAKTSMLRIKGFKYGEKPFSSTQVRFLLQFVIKFTGYMRYTIFCEITLFKFQKSAQECLATQNKWEASCKNGTKLSTTISSKGTAMDTSGVSPTSGSIPVTTTSDNTPATSLPVSPSRATIATTKATTTPAVMISSKTTASTSGTATLPMTTPTPPPACPHSYNAITKFDPPICYNLLMLPYTYDKAKKFCEREGSKLILLDSRERLQAIDEVVFAAATGATKPELIWLDASYQQGSWKTSDDSPFNYPDFLRSNWEEAHNVDGYCLSMKFTPPSTMSGWIAADCSKQGWFICTPEEG